MLILIAVLAFLSAAFLLIRLAFRHQPGFPIHTNLTLSEPPPNARPLFQPTDAELRRDAKLDEARQIARREYSATAEARAAVDKVLLDWRSTPDAARTIEMMRVASQSGSDGDFERAAREVLEHFSKTGITGLTDGDLAALLESHIMLLPAAERGSGAIFWLKQEVARLRTEVNS